MVNAVKIVEVTVKGIDGLIWCTAIGLAACSAWLVGEATKTKDLGYATFFALLVLMLAEVLSKQK